MIQWLNDAATEHCNKQKLSVVFVVCWNLSQRYVIQNTLLHNVRLCRLSTLNTNAPYIYMFVQHEPKDRSTLWLLLHSISLTHPSNPDQLSCIPTVAHLPQSIATALTVCWQAVVSLKACQSCPQSSCVCYMLVHSQTSLIQFTTHTPHSSYVQADYCKQSY